MGRYNRRRHGGYGGSVSFEYEIERFVHKDSGELFSELPEGDNAENYDVEEFTLDIEGFAYYTPGNYHGLPENCYPDESDCEIEKAIGPDGKNWYDVLTSDEISYINEKLIENVQSQDEDCYEPDRYDEWKDRDPGDDFFDY